MSKQKQNNKNNIAVNRRARHEYEILEEFEAGIELKGSEVKSLRQGKTSIGDAYVTVIDGEIYVLGWHIAPYEQASRFNVDPLRRRKLLLHRREIDYLAGKVQQAGLTIVPLRLYFKRGKAKLLIGLARGKRDYDKRETIRQREQKRDIERAIKQQFN